LLIPETRWWNIQLIRNIFLPFEAEQILQIPITNIARDDDFTWPKTKDGIYTVKSGYQAIYEWKNESINPSTGHNNDPNPIWQKIWKLKIPPKYNTLIWRLLHNALPVNRNLSNRGLLCYPLCPRCNETIEDQTHVFSNCRWARQIWFASPLTIKFEGQHKCFIDWLEECLIKSSTQNMELICAICYHIWKARNLLLSQNKDIPVMDALRNAQESLKDYQSQQKSLIMNSDHHTTQRRSHNNDNWKPPPRNGLKLNVDAHRFADDGHWGVGLILRKDDGELVGARTKVVYGVEEAVEAEAMGLEAAIEM
jgi:hypothetical protein